MAFWLFGRKKEDDEKWQYLHSKLEISFKNIKRDFKNMADWISHFDVSKKSHSEKIKDLDERLKTIEILLKDKQEFLDLDRLSKQTPVRFKRTSVRVQTAVQTARGGVQTGELSVILKSLTMMERALVWTLLNTNLKLNYNDLSLVMGKDRSTIRGQVNNIKRKSEDLIREIVESDGSKRFYISEDIKNTFLKQVKKELRGRKVKK
jgi:hypothetical protein